jgi:hypothetical protein
LENFPANLNRGRCWLCSYVLSTAGRWTRQRHRSRAPWGLDRLAPHPRSFKRHWYDLALARAPPPAPKLGGFRGLRFRAASPAPSRPEFRVYSSFWWRSLLGLVSVAKAARPYPQSRRRGAGFRADNYSRKFFEMKFPAEGFSGLNSA